MGTELKAPLISPETELSGITNEGGAENKICFLKNIMGLWMIQSVRRELGKRYSYAELCAMAEENREFPSRVDVNDGRFLAPDNMTEEIRAACREQGMPEPETPGELACVIYRSLADCYAKTAGEIETLTGKRYDCIYIVGGGSNADYLNRLTAEAAGKTVYAGPGEATAIGNLCVQMLSAEVFRTVEEARECVFHSFPIEKYEPAGKE